MKLNIKADEMDEIPDKTPIPGGPLWQGAIARAGEAPPWPVSGQVKLCRLVKTGAKATPGPFNESIGYTKFQIKLRMDNFLHLPN